MRPFLPLLCCCLLAFLAPPRLQANNITVTNLTKIGNDDDGVSDFTLTVSWENSWRLTAGPGNYDAAYVFARYRENGDRWLPLTLTALSSSTTGATVSPAPAPSPGFFVHRSGAGSGNVSYNLAAEWDFSAASVDGAANVEVKFFAIEMVYVPQGAFDLGDGTTDANQFYQGQGSIPSTNLFPYRVTSEAQISIGSGGLFYGDGGSSNTGDQLGPLPAAYPKGFAAFYCMKYEVSQQQWVDFFNTLTQMQKENLDVTGPAGKNSDGSPYPNRNGLSWPDTGDATTIAPYVAMNYVPNTFLLAYLDWAGLRPLTELEFEKACRGPRAANPGEYAWGTTTFSTTNYLLQNVNAANERITNPGVGVGNAAYGSITPDSDPVRVGIFAASAVNKTRPETGGTYYGIMEMSGNVMERCISVGNPGNRAFTGTAGDGLLTSDGRANVANWPTNGLSFRGGSIIANNRNMQVSNRIFGTYTGSISLEANGIRGAISAQ